MRNLAIITTLIFTALSSFASTNGGGILATTESIRSNPEIVYHLGQQDGLVKFAYGQLVDKKWNIKEMSLPVSEIISDKSAMTALDKSRSLKQWVELK